MVVIAVDCAAAFDAVATIPPLSLMMAATNAMAALLSTAAAQLTTRPPNLLLTYNKHWPLLAADGIAATTINHCRTVNDDNHLAVVVIDCATGLDCGGVNGGH